jgi:predicted permease
MTPDSLLLDLRHAWRSLRSAPGLAAAATLTLALGIGANLTIFSVVDAAMLKPLPYPSPEQLVNPYYVYQPGTPNETALADWTNWAHLDRWRAERQIFSAIATYGPAQRVSLANGVSAGVATVRRISPELLTMLGVTPRLGRWFTPDDVAAGRAVVLVTERFWRRSLDGQPDVLGRTLSVEGRQHTIIGVMPDTFGYGIGVGGPNDAGWVPFDEASARQATRSTFQTMARLRPGLGLAQARHETADAFDRLQREKPSTTSWRVDLEPVDVRSRAVATRTALTVLSGAVAFVLLIACANVANLLLSRALTRRREIAVRAALGASRGRIVQQLLVESSLIAGAGAAAALALAWWSSRALPAFLPDTLRLFEANPMTIDWRGFGFASLLLAVSAALCSVLPVLRASRTDVVDALDGSGRIAGDSRGGRRLWQGLQTAQIVFTVVLLTGAGLMTNSFTRMTTADPGYDADGLVSLTLRVPRERYRDGASWLALNDDVLSRVRALPGVQGAALGQAPPLGRGAARMFVEGREQESATSPLRLSLFGVDQHYFGVAGIPIRQGRGFTAEEVRGGATVAVIDERLAATWWPGESPLGKQVRFSLLPVWNTVIGVAGSVKTRSFAEPAGSVQAYHPSSAGFWLVFRAANPDEVIRLVQPALRQIDPAIDITEASLAIDLYDEPLAAPRFYSILMLLFGVVALATAGVGLYAIVSHSTSRRRREIGVRLALGAKVAQIRSLIIREALAPLGAGAIAGVLVAFWLTRYLESMLYQVAPHDPATYAAVLLCLSVVAGAAALVPAQRAARLNPLDTLREE